MPAQRVNDPNIPPRTAVGYLAMRWDTVGWAYGSGSLIDSRNVLTCSHNLIDQLTQPTFGHALEVLFYPAYDQGGGGNPPDGGAEVDIGFYSTAYYDGQDAWDVAVCRLHDPIVPTAFFVPTVTGEEIVGEDLFLTGYPGPGDGEMCEDLDQVAGVELSTNTLLYTNDTWPGNSGSPAWTYESVQDVVKQHGIHVSREAQELRRAVLITAGVFNWIAGALSRQTPDAPFHLEGL